MSDLDASALTEPVSDGRRNVHQGPLVRVGLVASLLLALFALAGATNPWRLVVLHDHQLALALVFSLSTLLALVIIIRLVRRRWVRRTAKVLAWLSGVYTVIVVVAAVAIPAMTPFTSIQSEETIRIADGLSVHRTTWNTGALHSCVELQVRTGNGWATRFGATTTCADTEGSEDWAVSALNGTVLVTRSNGTSCMYSIDVAQRRLQPGVIEDCEALGVID